MTDNPATGSFIKLTADIVSAYVSNNSVPSTDLPALIGQVQSGKLKVLKLNVDEAMNSAGRYNIRGIPTILVFKNGQVVLRIVDCLGWIAWCWPAQSGCSFSFSAPSELSEIGETALRGSEHFKSIERWYSGSGLLKVDTGVGEADPILCSANRKCQSDTFLFEAV